MTPLNKQSIERKANFDKTVNSLVEHPSLMSVVGEYEDYDPNRSLESLSVEDLCLAVIKRNPSVLEYIENQTERMCLEAVTIDSTTLKYVKNKTDAILQAV